MAQDMGARPGPPLACVTLSQLLYNDLQAGFPILAPQTPNTTAKLEQAEQKMFLVFCLVI